MQHKKDYILSILSSAMPIIILQLILLPIYSHKASQEQLGKFIIIMAIVNITAVIFGNSLNNIRLTNKEINISEEHFNCFLILLVILQFFVNFIFSYLKNLDYINILLISIWSVLLLLKSYYLVYFRIKLDFYNYLLSSIIYVIFIGIGSVIYLFSYMNIYFLLVLSELFSLIFIMIKNKNNIYIYRWSILPIDKIKDFSELTFSNLLSNIMNYSDRIFIDIILGSIFTPYFFIATTIGKLSNLLIAPINNVLLSYTVSDNTLKKDSNEFKKIVGIIFTVSVLNIFVYFISLEFIKLFYSKYLNDVRNYIFLGNYALMLLSASSIPQLTLIASNRFKENLFINLYTIIFMLILGIPLTYFLKITGFIWALFIVSIFKYIIIYYFLSKNNQISENK